MINRLLLIAPNESTFYKVGNDVGYYLAIILIVLLFIAVIVCLRYVGQDKYPPQPLEEEQS
ncbi:hypothetical protein [Thermoflavifilum thermophilum]|uniref:Uncharacterized protein n=1 Tax=Thermoflavifilum thermophilum TaxID=1393122 RepID=A0A1I7NA12_9BACT|nr:hypothetical protein [Thermoflavifilum thermophilum]SFV31488.1 hypothetical protein SAMN05660895_1090 [Thermoflavifilum thermophilum]